MSTKEKARQDAATSERARVGNAVTGNIPLTDCITPKSQRQALVYTVLPQGEHNAISSRDLARQCGYKGVRDLQLEISREREAGMLILSTCRGGGGYFRPAAGETGRQETAAFVATLRARAYSTLRALRAARRALEGLEGQLTIETDTEGNEDEQTKNPIPEKAI